MSATATVSDDEARELLVDLVSIPSPTGEEAAAAQRLADFFEAHDREVWIDEVGNVRAPADDAALLTSHIDTVPGEIPVEVDDEDQLWGRGSVDATGPLAAMAAAAVRTGVSFVGVVGEETDSRGARHLIAERDAPEAVVNGEPSGWDGITLGYRGFLAGTYLATSESGHTSRPEPNAIQDAIRWWSRVEDAFDPDESSIAPEAQRDEGGRESKDSRANQNSSSSDDGETAEIPVFEQVTTKPVSVEGGFTADGLSVEATMDVQLRIPPNRTAEGIREIAESELYGRSNTSSGQGPRDGELETGTVTWEEPTPPVMENPRNEVARAFRAAIRGEEGDPRLLRKTGTSDMNLYAQAWDCPMATYGPGDSDLDHAPNEHLDLGEFERSIAVLERVANRLQA
ncbi:M20/M25/M40 family metallo-hydrolase [Halostella pelagica]|uniref:M20/M25/M40 family metallo-hydrolase n=1 Tax=Halostella pelagica TaxID=2583824 RepID=UPI0010807E1C|nr:M20/M25/M40 family metallo-hydrolase [Halostella pelagica]